MNIQPIKFINYNQSYTNTSFTSKNGITKILSADKTLDAMALMSVPMMVAGLNVNQNGKENELMSDEDFKAKKKVVSKEIKQHENIKKITLNKNNILLTERILKSPELLDICGWNLHRYVNSDNAELQNAKIKFLDTTENEKDLIDSHTILRLLLHNIKDEKQANNYVEIIKIVSANEELRNFIKDSNSHRFSLQGLLTLNSNSKNLETIMNDENLKKHFEVLAFSGLGVEDNYDKLLTTLSNKKQFLENKDLIGIIDHETFGDSSGSNIYMSSENKPIMLINNAQLIRILSMENDEDIEKVLGCCNINNDSSIGQLNSKMPILRAFLDSKELFNNKDLRDNLQNILDSTKRITMAQMKANIIKKIDSSEKLLQNKELMDNLGKILLSATSEVNAKEVLDMLNRIEQE